MKNYIHFSQTPIISVLRLASGWFKLPTCDHKLGGLAIQPAKIYSLSEATLMREHVSSIKPSLIRSISERPADHSDELRPATEEIGRRPTVRRRAPRSQGAHL